MANLQLRDEFEGIIKKKLNGTLDCAYKKAHIPKGWAHIKINTFSKELAKEIEQELNK